MFIPDDEREGRKAALAKLMQLMGKEAAKRMGSMKKPMSASITIEGEDDDDGDDMDRMDSYAGADLGYGALDRDREMSFEPGAEDDEDENSDRPMMPKMGRYR